jgi:TetR/AcrR family transcriptional regulator, transcriptional repressor for nem operon
MLTRGFTATTVDDICAEAELTKGSFFHYFKSKEDFGEAALAHYWTSGQEMLQAHFDAVEDPLRRLHAYLDLMIALARDPDIPKSCLFGNFSQEVAPTNERLRAACSSGFAGWADQIAADLDEAQALYPPAAPFESRELAEHFIAIYEGSLILAKARGEGTVLERNIEHFRRYIDALFGRKGESDGEGSDRGRGRRRRTR